jgi:CBS domain containing-hemolysin-like protein
MKNLIYCLLVLFVSAIFSSTDANVYQILEKTLPAVLGACLGGVLACTSIVVSVLSGSSKQTKFKAKNSVKFTNFVNNLERDVKILVGCLFLVVMLPYLRVIDYPISLSLFYIDPCYLKQKVFSTFELFAALMAFLIIFELAGVLVTILKNMMTIHDTEI